jgi:hypothetical protein
LEADAMADTPAAPAATGPARLAGDMKRAWMIFAIIAVLSLVADQASKYWARDTLPVRPTGCEIPADIVAHRCVGVPVEVVADYWDWRLAVNTGAAFSMFSSTGGGRWLLTVVGIAAVLGMLYMMRKARPDQKALHWPWPGRQRRGRQPDRPHLRSARSPTSWSGSTRARSGRPSTSPTWRS